MKRYLKWYREGYLSSNGRCFDIGWKDEDAGGLNSEAWYKEWLETGNQEILKKILRYNLDDILAMEIIDRRLREFIE